MLERASVSAESVAYLFLRRLEAPTRSHRALGPAFWRHAGNQLDVPAWWPAYLDSVRDKTTSQPSATDEVLSDPCSSLIVRNRIAARGYSTGIRFRPTRTAARRSGVSGKRSLSRTTQKAQATSLATRVSTGSEDHGEAGYDGVHNRRENGEQRGYGQVSFPDTGIAAGEHKGKVVQDDIEEDELLNDNAYTDADQRKAWLQFVKSKRKEQLASRMLKFLAQSQSRPNLNAAMTAFLYIPLDRRAKEDYKFVVNAATKLHRYRDAIKIIQEAVSRDLGHVIYLQFISHCIGLKLWNTVALLWTTVQFPREPYDRAQRKDQHVSDLPFAGSGMRHLEAVDDLPEKILSLSLRLQNADPVIAAQRDVLTDICKRLVHVVTGSSSMMSSITANGLLTMLSVHGQLGSEAKLHLRAIKTITNLSERGSKADLALLTYQNYRFVCPDVFIRPWVYGGLIQICSDGRLPSSSYQYLLDEFRAMNGLPDELAFQKALEACARQGDAEAVEHIFEEYREAYKPSRLQHVNHLIHVYAVIGDYENARKQFDRIKDMGFQHNVATWTTLILSCARSNRNELAFGVFEEMQKSRVSPNAFTWSVLLSIAAKRGDLPLALSLFERAKHDQVSQMLPIVGPVVETYLRNDDPKGAESLVLRITQVSSTTSPIRLWNSLFRHYAFQGDSGAILHTQRLMNRYGVEPDSMTYAALMTALVVQGRTAEAARILRNLHFNKRLEANEFHYSILIHGYAKERKRDLATSVFNEMSERFPRITPSAKLALLHVQQHRDKATADQYRHETHHRFMDLERSEEFLAGLLADTTAADLSSNLPNPGFGRRSAREGLESIYYGSMVKFLQSQGEYGESARLLQQARDLPEEIFKTPGKSPTTSLSFLSSELNIAVGQSKWTDVARLWNQIYTTALGIARPLRLSTMTSSNAAGSVDSPTRISSQNPTLVAHNIKLLHQVPGENPFTSMLPSLPNEDDLSAQVLPAHRFLLSSALSTYMQALDYQYQHQKIIDLVRSVQTAGFELSGRNWNRYVQVLSKSQNVDHQVLAFQTFEQYLLPNAPPWPLLRRGKWISPSNLASGDEKSTTKIDKRRHIEALDQGLALPSYYTAIHLATVLLKAYRSMEEGDKRHLLSLQRYAPGTVRLVRETPFLGDRIQGVLLRGRRAIGDSTQRPRNSAKFDVAGVRGGRSSLNDVPIHVLEQIEDVIAPRNDIRSLMRGDSESDVSVPQSAISVSRADLPLAESATGEINRSPMILAAQGRYENEHELAERIKYEEQSKLDKLLQIRAETRTSRLVIDPHKGDPATVPPGLKEVMREGTRTNAAKVKLFTQYIQSGQRQTLRTAFQKIRDDDKRRDELVDDPQGVYSASRTSASQRRRRSRFIPMNVWMATNVRPTVDTRVLSRIIRQRYLRNQSITPQRYVAKNYLKDFSINRKVRAARKKEAQLVRKWSKTLSSLNDSPSDRSEEKDGESALSGFAPFVSNSNTEPQGESTSTRGNRRSEKLALSRGMRRFR